MIRARDASQLTIGVVVSTYNGDITEGLFNGAVSTLRAWNVAEKNIRIVRVSGAFEIPFGCLTLLSKKKKPDAIIALGCIVKGETEHDRHLASAMSHGIMDLMLRFTVPISFGVLTTNNLAQARIRSKGKDNAGIGAAVAALESALIPS
jgi:6,7-dimethyl-8-ribityllumazine synthase